MSGEPLIELKDVGCSKAPGQPIFANVNLTVSDGDIIVLQGKRFARSVALPRHGEICWADSENFYPLTAVASTPKTSFDTVLIHRLVQAAPWKRH